MKTHTVRILALWLPLAVAALCFAGCFTGCVATTYTGPAEAGKTPAKLQRISIFGDQSAASVDLINGKIEGYKSEQAQVAGAVAAEFLKAMPKP